MDPPRIAADAAPTGPRYRFDGVVVDERAHTVLRDGKPVALEPKAFAVLLVLLRHPGELLERDQLLDAVWGHRHVTPGVLTRAIAQLRHTLGDDPHRPHYIQTQHALGYRFIGQLLEPDEAPARAALQATDGAGLDAIAQPLQPESLRPTEGDTELSGRQAQAPAPVPQTAPSGTAGTASAVAPSAALPFAGQGSELGAAVGARPRPRAAPPPGPGRGYATRLAAPAVLVLVLVLVLALAWQRWSAREQAGMAPARETPPKWVAPQAPGPTRASIAVLPFTSLSVDRDDAYLAQGLAEEMHDTLAGVPGLKVAAQSTAAAAASGPADVNSMGVATALDASVRREGRRIRIHAQLIDTGTGYTLWSESYDRETDDVLALQSEIAAEVVQAVLAVLRPAQPANGADDPDGIACSLGAGQGQVYVDLDYTADTTPSASPDQCELERGSTLTWRGPPGEAAEFSVIFARGSPEGPDGDRVLASEPVGGREKITMTADNAPGSYKYDVEAYGRRVDPTIIIRNARGAKRGSE